MSPAAGQVEGRYLEAFVIAGALAVVAAILALMIPRHGDDAAVGSPAVA